MKPGRRIIAMEDCPFCGLCQPVTENTDKGTVFFLCQFRDGKPGCGTRIYLGPEPAKERLAAFKAVNPPQEDPTVDRIEDPKDRPEPEPEAEAEPKQSIWNKPIF